MTRIDETFAALKARGRTGLIAYLTVGFPDVETTLELAPAVVEAGVDLIELGVPFSDPLADGVTIQRSSQAALRHGVTLETCLEVCETLRKSMPLVPLVLMGYYNPFLAYGIDRFARRAVACGADGVIVPDLPPEEAGPLVKASRAQGLEVIFLLAPTSPDRRMEEVGRWAGGFLYCVSLTGVTGARRQLPSDLAAFLGRVRRHTTLPLAVGFGVSDEEHVRAIGQHAQAAIVGSALIEAMEEGGPGKHVEYARRFVARLARGASVKVRSG
ncbi:MAG: tryptophan synthase subunit alpha [Dehalococcoidia bacterium]